MPTYNPAAHPRLSAEAAELEPSKLAAFADQAEVMLRIAGTAYTGADRDALVLAVALQVNRLVRLEAMGGGVVQSESKGAQSYTLAKGASEGDGVDPIAERIVLQVTTRAGAAASAAGWSIAGSVR